ncbi:MAG: hypothetical protein ACI4QI_03170 [Candidatus Coproplasma sp.]
MWDENAPLELLKEMPQILSAENLCKIQEVIDKDKYINSMERQQDLCGQYAPFCDTCDKTVQYPCAVAYVKMMQAKGMNVEIEAMPCNTTEEIREELPPKTSKKIRIAIARRKV